jgi:hypothetical protein
MMVTSVLGVARTGFMVTAIIMTVRACFIATAYSTGSMRVLSALRTARSSTVMVCMTIALIMPIVDDTIVGVACHFIATGSRAIFMAVGFGFVTAGHVTSECGILCIWHRF